MTTKADFTPEEWDAVLEGPTSAGMIVSISQRGGTFREVVAIAKEFADVRKQSGHSELLDEIVSHKPEIDKTKTASPEAQKEHGLERIRAAVAIVESKATAEELADYRTFVVGVATRVASAKKESGDVAITETEASVVAEITAAVGS